MNRIVLGVIVAVMAISTDVSAQSRNSCVPTVQRTLSDAGIASSDIADITYVRERSGGDANVTLGYTAWIRLNSCRSGYVVINLTTQCWVEQTYTDGACRVNGIKRC